MDSFVHLGMKKTNKVYGLVRVSSESQSENTSIQNQKDSIKKYCNNYELKLVDTLEEIFTGTTNNRDSLNTLKQLVLNEECDSVIVYKLDRLMRNFSDGVVFIKFLMNNDVKIISVTEEVNSSTVSGRFFINMLLSISELERDTIVDRLKTGKRKNFLNHKRQHGRISFGYKKLNDTLVVNESESKIVKYIFKKYSELLKRDITKTKRSQTILRLLKKNDFKFRNKEFKSYHINQILKNDFYVGTLKSNDERTTHNYETIISKRLFNLVK